MMKRFGVVMILAMAAGSVMAANLLVNGNFESGNTGFSTSYAYDEYGTWPGRYSIKTNPQLWDGGYVSFKDHTSGSGLMLLVDGAGPAGGKAGQSCWTQTVAVDPNTTYTFSGWMAKLIQNYYTGSTLEVDINGVNQGQFVGPAYPAVWQQIVIAWNSGSADSATITIREITGVTWVVGNDFALDDLFFGIPVAGDADTSGCVNYVDFAWLSRNYLGGYPEMPAVWQEGNFNADPLVDINDLLLMASYWLDGCGV